MVKQWGNLWSVLFAFSVGVLMLTILLMRSEPVPSWVLVVYPVVGGLLGLAASRTSPTVEQMAWIESGTIAAAAVVVLSGLINLLLIDMVIRGSDMLGGEPIQQITFFVAPAAAALFWWALQRRLSRMRLASAGRHELMSQGGIPAE